MENKHKTNFMRTVILLLVMFFSIFTVRATEFVNGVRVIGGDLSTVLSLKYTLTNIGWNFVDADLNQEYAGERDFIYLLYTTTNQCDADNIITDFYVKIDKYDPSAPETIQHDGRTYHLVTYNGSDDFKDSKGDLNSNTDGSYIHLYYTTDDFPDYRAVTGISFKFIAAWNPGDAVCENGGSYAAEFNSGVSAVVESYRNIFMYAPTQKKADQMIGDIKVIGGTEDKVDELKKTYTKAGWKLVNKDLNAGCGSSSDYIYLLYKPTDNYLDGEFVTDFYLSNAKGTAPNSITHNGRTYYLASFDGSDNFINSKGDLNRGAGGDYIHLYYTKEPLSDNLCVSDIYFNKSSDGAVGKNGGSGGYDLNAGCGENTDYIYMHIRQWKIQDSWGYGTKESPLVLRCKAGWDKFAASVNNGKSYAGEYIQLPGNISGITTMAGTSSHPFGGTFDGNGYKLTVNISGTEQGVAPFHYIDGATIQNLTVDGTVSSTSKHAAGLVGFCSGGTNTISGCTIATDVSVSNANYAGGIVGHGKTSTLNIENCVYGGTISGFNAFAGGILGWCDGMTLKMTDCLFKGKFSPASNGMYHPVACKGGGSNVNLSINKTFYLYSVPATATGNNIIEGADGKPVSETLIDGQWDEPWTAADGHVYYRLSVNKKSLPYYYDFTTPLEDEGWKMWNCTTGTGINTDDYSNTLCFYFNYYSQSQYLYSPFIDSSLPIRFTFSVRKKYSRCQFYIGYTMSIEDDAEIYWTPFYTSTEDCDLEMDLPMGFKRIVIKAESSNNYWFRNFQFKPNIYVSPHELSVNDLAPRTANISWKAPATVLQVKGFTYQYRKSSNENWSDEKSLQTSSILLTNLTPDTDYHFRVKTLYENGESSYVTTNFHTPTFMELPFDTSFENGREALPCMEIVAPHADAIQAAFYTGISPTDFRWLTYRTGEHSFQYNVLFQKFGPQYLKIRFLPDNQAKTLTFYYRVDGNGGNSSFTVGYSSTSSNLDSFTWEETVNCNNEQWEMYQVVLPENCISVAIRYNTDCICDLHVDDLSIEITSTYAAPQNLAATDLPEQTATKLTWKKPDTEVTGYAYQYKKASDIDWSELKNTTANNVTLTSLDANKGYFFRVKALYSNKRSSNFATVNFLSNGGIQQLPFDWGFENQLGGFRLVDNVCQTRPVCYPNTQHDGKWGFLITNTLIVNGNLQYTDKPQYLISPRFNSEYGIKYTFYHRNSSYPGADSPAHFQVGYSTTTNDIKDFKWSETFIIREVGWIQHVGYAPVGTKYVAIKWLPTGRVLLLDDFHFEEISFIDLADNASNTDGISTLNDKNSLITLKNRTLYTDGDWNTLCLPFNVGDLRKTPLDGFSIKELDTESEHNRHRTGYQGGTLYLNFKDASYIQAGKPYIVRYNRIKGGDAECLGFTTENGSPSYTGEESGKLVDGDPYTKWCSNAENKYNDVWYTFFTASNPVKVTGYTLTTANYANIYPERNPKIWQLNARASKNDKWTTIDVRNVNNNSSDALPTYIIDSKTYDIATEKQGVYQYFCFIVKESGGDIMQLGELKLKGVIDDNAKPNITNPQFESVIKAGDPISVNSQDGKVTFKGTYASTTFNNEDKSILFLGSSNKLYYPVSGARIGAQRAYFQLNEELRMKSEESSIKEIVLSFGEEDESETSLSEELRVKSEESDDVWYDLSGCKLNGKPTKNGIYVNGGRKVVIK